MKAVYRIQNLKTGDFYIGSSVNYSYRKWIHLKQLREGRHHNPILQNSWNKHGEGAFLFAIIEEVLSNYDLIAREQLYIDKMNPKYNICRKAGSPLGTKHTYEARMNMSLAHKGKKLTKESILKRTKSVLGTKRRQATKDKMSHSAKKVAISQFDLNNNWIRDWEGAAIAARKLKLSQSHITGCCKMRKKTHGNFIWKYKSEE